MRRTKIKNPRIKSHGKCKETGKTMYPSMDDAKMGLSHIWSHDPSAKMDDLHTYQCPFCHEYHIGHISAYKKYLEKQNGSGNNPTDGSRMETGQ